MGYMFTYDTPPSELVALVCKVFDSCITDLQSVPHVQRYVMERLFWAKPEMIGSVQGDEPWVVELRTSIDAAVREATVPAQDYLRCFDQWIKFLNEDEAEYVAGLSHVQKSDDESDDSPSVKVDLGKLIQTLEFHQKQKNKILNAIPAKPLEAGLYCIATGEVRDMLATFEGLSGKGPKA